MTVDRIEPLDKRRSKVFLDGGFAFVLYGGELRKFQIEVGSVLTETVFRHILDQVICKRARERALYLLKYSARTEAQIRRKLKTGWYPDEAIESAVEFLKRYGYIDDQEYVRNYVDSCSGRKSRKEIQNKLRERGINREILETVFAQAEPDEEAQIRRILEKRRYCGDQSTPEEQRKHVSYLMRKGFAYDEIRRVMGELYYYT